MDEKQAMTKYYKRINELKYIINDLTLVLEMYLDNYLFDDDHKAKHRNLINIACIAIDKPRNIEELAALIDKEIRGLRE